jgi:ureidoacrylate peracid hydrolase
LLREQHIETVIISGTLSNCCCESTARDAQQLGFNVIFVEDANAALSDAEHNATLNNLASLFADIRSTTDTVSLLVSSAQ